MADALRDRFANIMTFDVTESAAGAITFGTVQTNVGIDSSRRTGVAILIDQIDYFVKSDNLALLVADNDSIQFGITISSGVTDLADMSDRRILDSGEIGSVLSGAAANLSMHIAPMTKQYFPPLIMAERTIHLGVQGVSLASVARVRARVYYRTVQITAEEFVEIAEVFRLVS